MDPEKEIKEYLCGGGSATRKTLIEQIDADSVEVARSLGNLVTSGEVEEHPEIDGAFRFADEN